MDIDLKWLIIPAMPFALLGLSRALWFLAGAPWSEPGLAASMCFSMGLAIGGSIAGFMASKGIQLTVSIGKSRNKGE